MSASCKIIQNEITNYIEGDVEIIEGYRFSQYKLVKRLTYYMNNIYPKGKVDSLGNYKYFFDISASRVDAEVKNIDFDTKDIMVYSEGKRDDFKVILSNLYLKEWMRMTGQGEKINEAVEMGSSWGNIIWKRVSDGYEILDLKNTYVINQTAKSLDSSPVIERHLLTQSDLRDKEGVWDNIEEVIENCGNKFFSPTYLSSNSDKSEVPLYEIYERNGEINEKALFEAQGRSGGDEKKYVLAKVVVAGLRGGNFNADAEGKYVLYAEKIDKMPYKEYHRGRYQGRWFRQGIYEILLDIQTRANEIGNQLARGLEWSAKTIFRSSDKVIANNIITDLNNGDIIRSVDIQQVPVRMQGFDQLIAEWNRIMELADKLTNAFEVITGESLPSGTPFRLGSMLNQNANKLYDFLREKLSLVLTDVIEEWVLPDMLKDLKCKDVLRLTGDPEMKKRYYEMLVDSWYIRNLVAIGPHSNEDREALKEIKLQELLSRKQELVKPEKDYFIEFKPRVQVIITDERTSLLAELESISNFINLETDPIRRSALVEMAMKKKGIDVSDLPKTEATQEQVAPQGMQAQLMQQGQAPQGQ